LTMGQVVRWIWMKPGESEWSVSLGHNLCGLAEGSHFGIKIFTHGSSLNYTQ
jgi:hypothetical protein